MKDRLKEAVERIKSSLDWKEQLDGLAEVLQESKLAKKDDVA
jgi:hypothetical protein